MTPIVNGLEQEFDGQLAFERRDAQTAMGNVSMKEYGLRGHPSYVIVGPDGKRLWSFTGPVSKEDLQSRLREYGQ